MLQQPYQIRLLECWAISDELQLCQETKKNQKGYHLDL